MKTLFDIHPWKLIETTLHREDMRLSESLTSLGNAHMGMRGNFEETYSGDCHRGTYLAGVWFPDKTRVGWWKNGYPDYFGKVINAMNLLEIGVSVDGHAIDLAKDEVIDFRRELDMEHGLLFRRMTVRTERGNVTIEAERFLSIRRKTLLAIRYRVTPSFVARVVFTPALDANVRNEDSNYAETFWMHSGQGALGEAAYVLTRTKENPFGTPRFTVGAAMRASYVQNLKANPGRVSFSAAHIVKAGETAEIVKMVCVDTSRDHETDEGLMASIQRELTAAWETGYCALRQEQCDAWRARWDDMDVRIDEDDSAQQGIRFNLFQMLSTYDGADPRLNIGPKGFTGEKYGGATYWDTEMFCLPMILSVMPPQAGQNLLAYRYLHLEKAKENAQKLGCEGALFPMVTFTGEECHNEWEITFEEIHRNAAMVYAAFMQYEYTGDAATLRRYSFPVMLEICRYWVSRAHFHEKKRRYMILGVTGPNEYENNVPNNWYTNRMAQFCLETAARYARTVIGLSGLKAYKSGEREIAKFERVARKMYLPEDHKTGLFLQQDGFLDKDIRPAASLDPAERPLNQHWSWDRILRSCFIKQADVLQGLYCLRHLYDEETIERNFAFYEPLTVHESSLSPCVHAILAADLSHYDKAIEMYRRTARLDLDNVNNDTEDGLHITSMCGSWMAIVKGFAGVRTEQGYLELAPHVPWAFRSFAFKMKYQGRDIDFEIRDGHLTMRLRLGAPINVRVDGQWLSLSGEAPVRCKIAHLEPKGAEA
ncbi:MAG: glycoside hydrolase family 65 protein [Oscillospiraceae bacterium]|jgi:maltose phosphorylase|nr:glycoside hydrolase family 65 protein [Oscillospiraceae bacterium]